MKILFTIASAPNLQADMVSDYQADTLFHGLRSVFGNDVVDFPRMWWMYEKDKKDRPDDFKRIWGGGFTVYGTLPDDSEINRDNTSQQLQDKEFDCVIVAIHHTIAGNSMVIQRIVNQARKYFPSSKIAVIDGWDRPWFCSNTAKEVLYFKRELYGFPDYPNKLKPISFSIPKDKICKDPFAVNDTGMGWKRKDKIAPLIPVNQSINPFYMSTYIYDTEEEYYQMYQDHLFGLTSKKGGWDTMRHYEIMANGCLPLFVDIENCPKNTLTFLPKELLKEIKEFSGLSLNLTEGEWKPGMTLPHCGVIDKNNPGRVSRWRHNEGQDLITPLQKQINEHVKTYNTTDFMARYVMDALC